jgi:hypothetical protein
VIVFALVARLGEGPLPLQQRGQRLLPDQPIQLALVQPETAAVLAVVDLDPLPLDGGELAGAKRTE